MSLIKKFDTDVNFWDINAEYKVIEPFKSLYKKDRTIGKIYSSRILWAVSFLVHPDSPIDRLPENDKKFIITTDYLEDTKFDWDKYQDLIDKFTELELTKAERSLKIINEKIEDRERLLRDTPYSLGNAKDLDDMITKTDKIYDLRKKLEDDAKRKDTDGVLKGGAEESISEKGLI